MTIDFVIKQDSEIKLSLVIDGKVIYDELRLHEYMGCEILKCLGCERCDEELEVHGDNDILAAFHKNDDSSKWK